MNKTTAGILVGAGVIGLATSAYIPVKVGDAAQQQIELAVASVNASQGASGVEVQLVDYRKSAYSSVLTTRFTFNDPAMVQMDGKAPYVDILHNLDHGFSHVTFRSEVVVTDSMKASLEDFGGKVPVHFDGRIASDRATLNSYIEGFTINQQKGTIRVNPGIVRLDYDIDQASYRVNGAWNGMLLDAKGDQLTFGNTRFTGKGQRQTEHLWHYKNSLNIEQVDLSNSHIQVHSEEIGLSDQFTFTSGQAEEQQIHYSGTMSVDQLHIAQYGQTLYDILPSGFSYSLTGPSVGKTEALVAIAQEMDAEQMTPADAQKILPVFADVVNAAEFRLSDLSLVTPEGRIAGELSLSLDTNQGELIKALSFPPILANYIRVQSDAAINKSLFDSMPVFAMMAMQLNQMGAYKEDDRDMLIEAKMEQGQLTINGVPMR